MADYPLITLLSQIDETIPAGGESAAKLDDSVRQIKAFLKAFLTVAHDDTGALKAGATAIASIVDGSLTYAKLQNVSAADKLLGRVTSGAGVVEEVACTAAGRALLDDVDNIAQRATLGLGVIAVKASIGAVDIDADAVQTAKIVNDAVTAPKLASNAVTEAKIAANAVTPGKISNIGDAKILVGDGSATIAATVAGALSAVRSGSTLVFSLASGGSGSGFSATYALLEERMSSGGDAGGSTATTYVARTLTEIADPGDIVGVSGASVTLRQIGTYLVHASAPAHGVGKHKIKIRQTSGTATDLLFGTTERAAASSMSRSEVVGLITTSEVNVVIQLQHWCETTVATDGLGKAAGAGDTEVYARLELVKV